jgi:hypothetical protein
VRPGAAVVWQEGGENRFAKILANDGPNFTNIGRFVEKGVAARFLGLMFRIAMSISG